MLYRRDTYRFTEERTSATYGVDWLAQANRSYPELRVTRWYVRDDRHRQKGKTKTSYDVSLRFVTAVSGEENPSQMPMARVEIIGSQVPLGRLVRMLNGRMLTLFHALGVQFDYDVEE
jgi:hypothetical protein